MITCYCISAFVTAITLYPIIYILSASLSDPYAVMRGEVWIFPKGINLDAYIRVLNNPEVWISYYNTLWYVIIGTTLSVILTAMTAYPLARKKFAGRKVVTILLTFTMFFSGGLIPLYIVIQKLGLINSRLSIILPCTIITYYLIIMRTFFEGIPESIHESATLDGYSDVGIFIRIVIPLSKPIIAVMSIFYAVGLWNSYLYALLFLNSEKMYPIQMLLRKILIQLDDAYMLTDVVDAKKEFLAQTVRYATIIVATVPILCIYPFFQKHFAKGGMIGAIKE